MSRQSLLIPLRQLLRPHLGKRFRCEWCRQNFNDHAELLEHNQKSSQTITSDKRQCVVRRCEWCRRDFDGHVELLEHNQGTVQTISSGEKQCVLIQPYSCEWCDARFGTAVGIAVHIRETKQVSSPAGPECQSIPPHSTKNRIESIEEPEFAISGVESPAESCVEEATAPMGLSTRTGDAGAPAMYALNAINEEHEEESTHSRFVECTHPRLEYTYSPSLDFKIGQVHAQIGEQGNHADKTLENTVPANLDVWDSADAYYTAMSRGPNDAGVHQQLANRYKSSSRVVGMPSLNHNGAMRFNTTGSTRSYATARTSPSFASYRTAPSMSHRSLPHSAMDTFTINLPSRLVDSILNLEDSQSKLEFKTLDELARHVLFEAEIAKVSISPWIHITIEAVTRSFFRRLTESQILTIASFSSGIENMVQETCEVLFPSHGQSIELRRFRAAAARHMIDYFVTICDLGYMADDLENYFRLRNPLREKQPQVFSSKWLDHLRARGLMPDQHDELNWSGRGQHIEYDQNRSNTSHSGSRKRSATAQQPSLTALCAVAYVSRARRLDAPGKLPNKTTLSRLSICTAYSMPMSYALWVPTLSSKTWQFCYTLPHRGTWRNFWMKCSTLRAP